MKKVFVLIFVLLGVFACQSGLDEFETTNPLDPENTLGEVSSSTLSSSNSQIDGAVLTDSRDGQTYAIVTIGTQTWMAENLNYDAGTGSYCENSDTSNCDTYGRLYEWSVAMNGASSSDATPSGVQGVCPSGWHLPSDAEWDTLLNYVIANSQATDKSNVGKYLKANSLLWNFSSGITNDDSFGFSALPGGNYYDDSFDGQGNSGYWWASNEDGSDNANYRNLYYEDGNFDKDNYNKSYAFSVRCLKN